MPAAASSPLPLNAGAPTPAMISRMRGSLRAHRWRKFKSALTAAICLACNAAVITPLALVFGYLLVKGAGSLNLAFFTQLPVPVGETGGGIANAIAGTLILVAIAAAVGVPIGVLGAIYLAEFSGPRFAGGVRFAADILNGVPSIVWGIVAYALLVLPHGSPFSLGHFSAYAGGMALGLIMIPLVLRTTEEVLLLVPNGYREAALALGIARWRIIIQIIVKTAFKGILTGVLLAVARVAGETAPLLFTALGNQYWTKSLKEPISALPLQIFNYAISPYDDLHRQAWAAALVLLVLVLGLNLGLRFLTRERIVRLVLTTPAPSAAAAAPPIASA
jgi:phosphate transport system permease protein